jgi:hypothetical protein
MKMLLDHSIVGQSATTLSIRKDREFAGCRICGAVFQSRMAIEVSDEEWEAERVIFETAVAIETRQWRNKHSAKHPMREHVALEKSGLTFTPEATIKLAPFGLVPVSDAEVTEIAQAMREAPRAPIDDVETTLKGWR